MVNVAPYAGKEPYIFVSYAHRNADQVLPVISRLIESGYRIWYDEGIDPGTEWDENIAAHVEGCSFFLALISAAYLASDNCKDELNYARDLNKQRVLVYLEQVELPGGMRMRLSRIQAVHKYSYSDEAAFYDKLFSAQGIHVCLQANVGHGAPPATTVVPGIPATSVTPSVPDVLERVEIRQMSAIPAAAQPKGHFPTTLLRAAVPPAMVDAALDADRAKKLQKLMTAYQAPIWLQRITHGMSVSRYELSMGFGTKVTALNTRLDNIAMELEVPSIRLEAPIPGTSLIGLEVPRKPRQTLSLRALLESEAMQNAEGSLPVALGTNVKGESVIVDLAKLPHLILGGVTGSGKSVCLHSIIASLLYRQKPEDVKLFLADVRGIELVAYSGLPNSRATVAVDPFAIRFLLVQLVKEMTNRYTRFQEKNVRSIDGYNASLAPGEAKLPRIVFVIDELADLMMHCKKDAEEAICRLAQLAKATGIHLVIATQITRMEVLTGLIRANIPSRIAFRTPTKEDSRVLLDQAGAETLQGCGDMLYMPSGACAPIRVQGCYVSQDEVRHVVNFLREGGAVDMSVQPRLGAEAVNLVRKMGILVREQKALLARSIDIAVEQGEIAAFQLTRKLRIGFNRAWSLVQEMEKLGVIIAEEGVTIRRCRISKEELKRRRDRGELP